MQREGFNGHAVGILVFAGRAHAQSATAGGGGAGIPDERMPGSGDRTNGSAKPRAGAAPPGWLRRRRSSASRAPADHPVAARVNRDASLSCRAPDSDACDRHARAALGGWSGNAVRQHAARGVGRVWHSLRHSRFGRDRSSCRSGSGCGNRRTETAGLIGPRGARTGRPYVDERHDCRDIGAAYVSSTVWGTASMRDRQVGPGAVLAPQCRNATPPLVTASAAHALRRCRRHALTDPAIADMPLRQRHFGGRFHHTNSGSPRQKCAGPGSHRHRRCTSALHGRGWMRFPAKPA